MMSTTALDEELRLAEVVGVSGTYIEKFGPLGLPVIEVVRTSTFVDGDNVASVSLAPEEPEKLDVPEVEVDAETVTLVLDSVALVEMKDERDDEDEPADKEDVRTDGEGVRIDDDEDVRDDDDEDVRDDDDEDVRDDEDLDELVEVLEELNPLLLDVLEVLGVDDIDEDFEVVFE